ncbi:hypothetical protein [uncultured Pseudokineococcus sp.]|uniref:hypothetical protein n=1 Tax=uncultured Pseudokineococcus sp. TaxID=1642928 RepID=UPI00262C3C00|nr:hypothetical protein [uncultured Pseudokineococcus sp.]
MSSPVIGFDLVRHPSGPQAALVLRYAVGAGAEHVRALAATAAGGRAGAAAAAARDHAERSPGQDATALARVVLQAGDAGAARSLLEVGSLGGLPDLLALVRERVVSQCWARPTLLHPPGEGADLLDDDERAAAAEAVEAALVRAWTGASPPAGEDPFRAAMAVAPARPAPLGEAAARVRDALGRLASATPAQVEGLRRAAAPPASGAPGPGSWARAVHDVSVDLESAGRTEAAACVQLEAVGAARLAGLDAPSAAAGAWQVASGALHALVAGSTGASARSLLAPWERALGVPAPPATGSRPVPRPRGSLDPGTGAGEAGAGEPGAGGPDQGEPWA